MKRSMLFLLCVFILTIADGQLKPFRFALISDTHIGSPNGTAEDDLRRTVRDINSMKDIAFVVLTGDITELGTDEEIKLAKKILDSLNVPWYIIPGNHDSGWSESGGFSFVKIFGYDKFSFEYGGIRFLGCASGPYVRMGDGHVPRDAINWLDVELKKLKPGQPVIFLNHYPIDNGLDNWYEITDRLKKYNTWAILCGHGHANKAMNFEDIPAVMGRSNLRAKAEIGGYNVVDVRNDSIIFSERRPGKETLPSWTGIEIIPIAKYDLSKKFTRPDYSVNTTYQQVRSKWLFSSDANVISTPSVGNDLVVFGNQNGEIVALSLKNGKKKWSYKTQGSIFSSPAFSEDKFILGSADGYVYGLNAKGKAEWKLKTGASVLGSPIVNDRIVYIGGSDHCFMAIELKTGKPIWRSCVLEGPVVSTPLLYEDKIIFGAWDRNLYALDKNNGKLLWKWNNGSAVRNFSPASCIPVAYDGVIYVVAPDRFITAIDASTGKTLWRNNDATVRESIGISIDARPDDSVGRGKWVYGKTMQDTIVAYATGKEKQSAAWKMHCGFGYEHVPSMLIEKEGQLFFGTKNGVVYSIDPIKQKIIWAHKIDNSMINTVRVLNKHHLIVSTMDGKVTLLEVNKE